VSWRWSHARHHTDTIIVGRDPEIACMKPPNVWRLAASYAGVIDMWQSMAVTLRNAAGRLSAAEKDYIPESEWSKAIFAARVHVAVYAATLLAALVLRSWIPLMLIGLPRIFGCWHMLMTGLIQHCGMDENVTDHRLNSRSVLMNPVSRFIYWNMNYHVEHHMFPMVPYHALPRLHDIIKADLPAPNRSIAEGFAEMWPALKRQLFQEDYFLKRELPPTAKPYREDFHQYVPGMMAPKAAE